MPFGDRRFDFGVNMAWLNCANGHDLGGNPYFSGPRPHPDWGNAWSDEFVSAYFRDIGSKGFKVVRVWAFEKLEGLQFESAQFDPTQIIGHRRDGDRTISWDNYRNYENWNIPNVRSSPNGLRSEFQEHVRRLMEIATANDLEIYWTILSGGNYFKNPGGHHEWALKKMLENATYRSRFIEHALVPFLRILKNDTDDFTDNVYAIDLINEPEGFCYWNPSVTVMQEWPNIPSDTLEDYALNYIIAASDMIRNLFGDEFALSVGFRSKSTIENNLSALDPKLDFFDFHHYHRATLDQDPFPDKPTILGELGYMSTFGSFTPDDREQKDAVDGIIGEALTRNYRGCLVWMYTPHASADDSNNLIEADGNNPCISSRNAAADAATREAFLRSFTSNPDAHWRLVRAAIERHRVEVERRNSGTP